MIRQAAELALKQLREAGVERSEAVASVMEKNELNVEAGEVSLYRTVLNYNLSVKAIRAGHQGTARVNKLDRDSIESAVQEALSILEAGAADPAYDIAPNQPKKTFEHGVQRPDQDAMHHRLVEMLDGCKTTYPLAILEGANLDHVSTEQVFLNSNGVDFHSRQGRYGLMVMFTSKEDGKAASFNFTGGSLQTLDRPLFDCFGLAELLRQSREQIHTRSVPEKFSGELLLTPHSLPSLLGAYLGYLSDGSLINGTSIFKDQLGQQIASNLLSVRSEPRGAAMATHEFFDDDGFESESFDILRDGVLKSFLLGLYGSRKTGKDKAKSGGGYWVVAPGADGLEAMIGRVKRGIVLGRFSGGRPSENGDFSGVAKNSYYIENGKVLYPVSETMISGNLVQLFQGLGAISRETIAFGNGVFPWLLARGVTVSGK